MAFFSMLTYHLSLNEIQGDENKTSVKFVATKNSVGTGQVSLCPYMHMDLRQHKLESNLNINYQYYYRSLFWEVVTYRERESRFYPCSSV
jgi:hypothetical protein